MAAKPNPQAIQTRIAHLLKHWPVDNVRPASVSVQTYLQASLSQANAAESQQKQPQQTPPVNISQSSADALSSLLEDRYARRYPLSPRMRHPASNPDYYDNLLREIDEAPSRDWLGRLRKRLAGVFRFK
ncbi:hypothetical protein BO70DRAFT_377968 [Aspergillus heteromorphus CBS 117.55]|uniref:Uncharacterized protein n=1 Tax=Aspergillus heteromorphus CBS 117.55 TaxID=1448321 RepID=A0A317WRY2_9EURO|nr:uncharacterized protein BO70DRAFT_377968 [Aspergillus heteromorphus CBS 117.55]PWY88491.1 hypothetical protein BO70DRAFT_377968 [Aspergillus heteromorphus CBS 117.55]